jgi:CRP-like cAMP-binding protein
MQVLAFMSEGHTNLGIAKRLDLKESTVKVHVHNTFQKLGVQNRTQATRIGERLQAIRDIQVEHARSSGSLRDWLLPHMTDELRRKGEILFRRGDPGEALYYIQQGRIALKEIGEVIGEGELLGEIGIFAPGRKRTCTAYCETDSRLFRLSDTQAQRLYLENAQFAYHVVQLIARRLDGDRERFLQSGSGQLKP